MNNFYCKYCQSNKTRIKTDIHREYGHFYVYVDDLGRQWNRARCPDCKNDYDKEYKARKALVKDHDNKSVTFQKGRQKELQFQVVFETVTGLSLVKNTFTHGTDFKLNDKSIEIKSARAKAGNIGRYTVERIRDAQKSRDYIGVVFPNGGILVEPMADYLAKCTAYGTRIWKEAAIPTTANHQICKF